MTALPWPVHPAADRLPLLDDEALAALAADIEAHGLNEPVWLYDDPHRGVVLLDGRNRARACALAGIDVTQHVRQYRGRRPWAFVHSENIRRRHLSAGQSIAYVMGARDELQAEQEAEDRWRRAGEDALRRKVEAAAETQRRAGERARAAAAVDDDDPPVDHQECAPVHTPGDPLPEPEPAKPHRAADDIAEVAGVSGRSVAQFLRIQGQAPDLVEKVESGEMSLADAEREIRQRNKAARVAQIAAAPVAELPADVTFPVLLADPPWRYDYAEDTARQIENHYPTMAVEDIADLDVPAADDAVLFCWATSPKLREALAVVEAWGFTYRTCMVWVKDKIGMGYYARQQHELLLVATRGQLPVPDPADRPPSVIHGARTEHSAKPVTAYEAIERMYPHYRRAELFARTGRDGWFAWGNQAGEDVA